MSPGLVTLILGAQPLLVPFIQQMNPPIDKKICLLIGFLGLCVAVSGTVQLDDMSWWGCIFALLALLSLTFGALRKNHGIHPVQAMLYQCVLSSIIFSIVSTTLGWHIEWNIMLLTSLLWMSLVVSIGAFLLLVYMINYDQADRVSLLFYAVPPLTYCFDYAFFGTTLSTITLLGISLVTMSIVYYRKQTSAKPQSEKSLELHQNKH
jgi:drug/metabolite transporter (DMT)-like permease